MSKQRVKCRAIVVLQAGQTVAGGRNLTLSSRFGRFPTRWRADGCSVAAAVSNEPLGRLAALPPERRPAIFLRRAMRPRRISSPRGAVTITERECVLLKMLLKNAVALLDVTGTHPVAAELVALHGKLAGLPWLSVEEQMNEILDAAAQKKRVAK